MTREQQSSAQTSPEQPDIHEFELGILDFLTLLAKHKVLVLCLPLLAAMISAGYALRLTNVYTSTALILPPPQNQSAAGALASQLGQLGGALTGGAIGRNPLEVYISMLRSRALGDAMVARFDLVQSYGASSAAAARNQLANSSRFDFGKDNLISITVDDGDPVRAANLANGFVDELSKLLNVFAVTEAGHRRLFLESRVNQTRENLAKAENAARAAITKGGIAAVDVAGRNLIATSASLRARASAKEVEISVMKSYASDDNPQLVKARHEVMALREQVLKMEGGGEGFGFGDGRGGDAYGLLREVRYQETLLDLLSRQYEAAKIDESRSGNIIQVLDSAIPAEARSRPNRTAIVLAGTAIAFLVGVVLALIAEASERLLRSSDGRKKWNQLRLQLMSFSRLDQ